MALNTSALASGIQQAYRNGNTPAQSADAYAQAIVNFWETGTAPNGGAVTATPAKSLISSIADGTYRSYATPDAAARAIASAINSGFLSVIASGGGYGTHVSVTSTGQSTLASELTRIWTSYPADVSIAAKQESQAIYNFTVAGIFTGTGPGGGSPPAVGPLT